MIHLPLYEYFSTLLWFIIPFRQFRQKYFSYFFLIIAGGLITDILMGFDISHTNSIYVFAVFFRVVFIQDKDISKAVKILFIISFIIICYLEFIGLDYKREFLIICTFHFLLFIKFLQAFIIQLVKEREISLFLLCLFFYELTLITKYFAIITDLKLGTVYFITTTVFEMLFAVFFCIFKQDSRKILIKINTPT